MKAIEAIATFVFEAAKDANKEFGLEQITEFVSVCPGDYAAVCHDYELGVHSYEGQLYLLFTPYGSMGSPEGYFSFEDPELFDKLNEFVGEVIADYYA